MVIYKGRVFSVEVDQVVLPDGRQTELAIVRHRPSVVLVPVRDDGRIVMIRQYRHALMKDLWELPAGNVDAGESAEAAAARECEEEIGEVPARIERLGAFYPTPGYCDEEMIFFRVSELRPPSPDSPHKPDEDEAITTHPMSPAEAKAMVARGQIVDLKTAYALTLI
ncbi:MAG TPA: NUDIX hydrolase [Vicinamibacterales bacterium]|jgi:ADP-ribose pyrophosphatase|nr:NUDIX hydrolase [Vicinamibacterales bacterium]